MRFLVDGYNLMFAQGLLGQRFGPDRFRKVRTRFLNDLSDALGAVDAHLTTVVFDAAAPPEDRPREMTHKGLRVVFAIDDENADERIERLIAEHSAPRSLTVVSSDNRIRQAATRRRAKALTADEFLASLDERKNARPGSTAPAAEPKRDAPLSPAEADYWLRQFSALEAEADTKAAFANDTGIPTDQEIAEIEREVEREFGPED